MTFKLGTWNESLQMVLNGEADFHCGLFFTKERNKFYDFSTPIYHTRSALVMNANLQCDDVSRLLVGGIPGTAEFAEIRWRYPRAQFSPLNDSYAILDALERGAIQVAINDWATLSMLANEKGLLNKVRFCEIILEGDLLAGVSKGRPELVNTINMGIAMITEDERRYLENLWFIGRGELPYWRNINMPVVLIMILMITIGVYQANAKRK